MSALHPTNPSEEFTRLWTTAQPAVTAYLATQAPDFRDGQDLLQTVAIVALRRFSTYDPARPFLPWVLGIARLEVLQLRRGQARSPLILADAPELTEVVSDVCEELSSEFEQRSRHLTTCLQELAGRPAELIRLRYQEALPTPALAARFRMSEVAVRVALARVRSALRRCIERHLGWTESHS